MREEYELEVLEKYDIEVKSTRRIRGAFFCIGSELKSGRVGDFGDCLQSRSVPFGAAGDYDTKERPMLLKETKLSERRALFFPFHLFHRCDRMCLLFGNTCLGAGYALFGRRVF